MTGIETSLENLEADRANPLLVSGGFWFTLCGRDFPATHWTDSPVSVLGSLGQAIRDAAAGETGEVYFFDGPYYVKLIPAPGASHPHLVTVVGICDREGLISGTGEGVIEARCDSSLAELRRTHRDALLKLADWARQEGNVELTDALARMTLSGPDG